MSHGTYSLMPEEYHRRYNIDPKWVPFPKEVENINAAAERRIQEDKIKVDQHDQATRSKCSFCHKPSSEPLPGCSLCKSTRYCDAKCQLAHYKAGHKQECTGFVHPPFTKEFLTEPLEGDEFPPTPVFAQGHIEGLGCWVSTAGKIGCELSTLLEPMGDDGEKESDKRLNRIGGDMTTSAQYAIWGESLITVSVLVQNRRKDSTPILIFGARTQITSHGEAAKDVIEGRTEKDTVSTFQAGGDTHAVLSVAYDPFKKASRLLLKSLNGVPVSPEAPPAAVKDVQNGVVALHRGDFAIFHAQFRVGDNHHIKNDGQAFGRLAALHVAFTPWHGTPPSVLDDILAAHLGHDDRAPAGLRARFNQPVVSAYYAELARGGPLAHITRRYGAERAALERVLVRVKEIAGVEMFDMMRDCIRPEVVDRMLGNMRAAGLNWFAELIGPLVKHSS
ncbi:hypothetical protein C8Q79DRAFT_1102149 [Trametes meyenii]|nr:hypothetical protein C8Q79DRAFT_1102149 [Trametes meyenii]